VLGKRGGQGPWIRNKLDEILGGNGHGRLGERGVHGKQAAAAVGDNLKAQLSRCPTEQGLGLAAGWLEQRAAGLPV
jgi:hypothetical protein